MTIDWAQLIRVRERHRAAAQEVVARDRLVAERSAAEVAQANAAWQREAQAGQAYWVQMSQSLTRGACSVDAVRHADRWGRVLDARVKQAHQALLQTQALHAQHLAVLHHSAQALRAAMAELRRAEEMQLRERRAAALRGEIRQEERSEEAARQRWGAQRLPRHGHGRAV